MRKAWWVSVGVVLGLSTVGRTAGEDEKSQSPAASADSPKSSAAGAGAPDDGPVSEQITKRMADYKTDQEWWRAAARKGQGELERLNKAGVKRIDFGTYSHQLVDLAAKAPHETAARDALIWVIFQPSRSDMGNSPWVDEFSRAVNLLVQFHSDDPEVARVGLTLDGAMTRRRDAFLEGIYANAQNRETKGLARMALGNYLARKVDFVESARQSAAPKPGYVQTRGKDGKTVERLYVHPNDQKGYRIHLRLLDPVAVREEAERLLEEVIADYGDIPYITPRHRELEARLRELPPEAVADEDQKTQRLAAERILARRKTLAEVAEARLDEMYNIAVGKPAPEIEGMTLDGKILKLSDYRGKVVVSDFWFSGCGPCIAQVPHERELVERLKGKPFALLGVDCEESKQAAIDKMKEQGMTWPSWFDDRLGDRPIVSRYHVKGYPTEIVIDDRGIIRHKRLRGSALDKAVDDLLKEMETRAGAKE
jgi:thiol-disulfide isomerase/thioredoxin